MSDQEKIPLVNENNDDMNDDLIELLDEDGNSTTFEHLATLEYQGESYIALCEPESDDEDKDLEVFILKIETDENGDDFYTVPDDDIADAVFEQFTRLVDDLED